MFSPLCHWHKPTKATTNYKISSHSSKKNKLKTYNHLYSFFICSFFFLSIMSVYFWLSSYSRVHSFPLFLPSPYTSFIQFQFLTSVCSSSCECERKNNKLLYIILLPFYYVKSVAFRVSRKLLPCFFYSLSLLSFTLFILHSN